MLAGLAERGGWLLHDWQPSGEDSLEARHNRLERRLQPTLSAEEIMADRRPQAPVEVPETFHAQYSGGSRWRVLFAPFHRSKTEHNTISEMRAVHQALKHYVGSFQNWHTRFIILSDAGAAIGAFSKGRSSSHLANSLCRRVCVLCCVADIRVYLRWIRSEHNPADGPSRGTRFACAHAETIKKAAQKARAVLSLSTRFSGAGR